MGGSFPWRDSSSPRIGFSRGPGNSPLVGGEGGVGGRGGDGPRGGGGERGHFGTSKRCWVGVGVVLNRSCGSGFRVVVRGVVGSSFIGVEGRVLMNLRSYSDSIDLGSVGSGFGLARNMHFRRSSVQYWSSGVSRRDLSSSFIRAAGSTRIAC